MVVDCAGEAYPGCKSFTTTLLKITLAHVPGIKVVSSHTSHVV